MFGELLEQYHLNQINIDELLEHVYCLGQKDIHNIISQALDKAMQKVESEHPDNEIETKLGDYSVCYGADLLKYYLEEKLIK